ncbi:putative sulfide-quinone reductase [Mycobacterium xenopi 4042]|uniref:Putative sulfide-quinone reductase n=1 Tax=Mycobacterium xenopi 4042 TaxID=1299334 RepID=X8AQN9_MYCXE|nr:putative sulfide-quinone reductase [Mycobacterium xenopi 4042]
MHRRARRRGGKALDQVIAKLKSGEKHRLVVGVGHGTCTCDFGVGGMQFEDQGFLQSSPMWSESLFRERGVKAITQAAVHEVMDGKLRYEQLDGQERDLDFDFAMLLQPFRGANLTAYDKDGNDITSTLFARRAFSRSTPTIRASRTTSGPPRTGRTPTSRPPIPISSRRASRSRRRPDLQTTQERQRDGNYAQPAAHRDAVGHHGQDGCRDDPRPHQKPEATTHRASMATMGAACVASAGTGLRQGSAAAMTMFPVVPDPVKYPQTGRDIAGTFGELGLAGHWIKVMLHHLFIYKAKAKPLWWLIPE